MLHLRLQSFRLGAFDSEETGKKTMGAVYLNHILYHCKVSRMSGMLQGSIEDTIAECVQNTQDNAR